MNRSEKNIDEISHVTALFIVPGTDPAVLETVATHSHSLVLTTFALGSLPTSLHAAVRKITNSGKPVFILSDNPGESHGVIRIVDQLQLDTQASGAIFLEKANVNNEQEVYAAIQAAVANGLRGSKLGEAIRQQFSYGPGEEKPTSILDKPEEMIRELRKRFGRQ